MPGMMRWSCSRGCCVRDGRTAEKRDWQRTEWQQTDPHTYWSDFACEPAYYLSDEWCCIDFAGWFTALQDGELPAMIETG